MQCISCNSHTTAEQEEVFFYTFETVDIPIVFKDKSVLDDYKSIVISIRHLNTGRQIDLDVDESCEIDDENGIITLHLTQEQTGKFSDGYVELQINILYDDDERDVSGKHKIRVYDNLHKKVME